MKILDCEKSPDAFVHNWVGGGVGGMDLLFFWEFGSLFRSDPDPDSDLNPSLEVEDVGLIAEQTCKKAIEIKTSKKKKRMNLMIGYDLLVFLGARF